MFNLHQRKAVWKIFDSRSWTFLCLIFRKLIAKKCLPNTSEDFLSKIDNIPILDNVPDIPYSINQLENAMDVSFTGQLKTICDPIFHPASLTYENITLTKIEQQWKKQYLH